MAEARPIIDPYHPLLCLGWGWRPGRHLAQGVVATGQIAVVESAFKEIGFTGSWNVRNWESVSIMCHRIPSGTSIILPGR